MSDPRISKTDFLKELSKQVLFGKALSERSVDTVTELGNLERDFKTWDDKNRELLLSDTIDLKHKLWEKYINAPTVHRVSYKYNKNTKLKDSKSRKLLSLLEEIKVRLNNLTSIQLDWENKIDAEISTLSPTLIEEVKTGNRKVFIVHGHNEPIKDSVAGFLSKLELEPVILDEKASEGRSIIEKFEKHADVTFAIVLLTKDDTGKAEKESDYQSRARQNVILELGFFIGKLTRKKTAILCEPGVERPSDIEGLGYILIETNKNWKNDLFTELKAAGFDIDANKFLG